MKREQFRLLSEIINNIVDDLYYYHYSPIMSSPSSLWGGGGAGVLPSGQGSSSDGERVDSCLLHCLDVWRYP